MSKTFPSSLSFRQSLESRLQAISKRTGIDLQRIRRKVAFERFLARLFSVRPYPWILKGGYALEVRFKMARATKDLDLGIRLKMADTIDEQRVVLLANLQQCAELKSGDHFQFRVEPAVQSIESAPYGGFRFPVRSIIAGKLFVAFSLDVGFGDAITPPTVEIEGSNWLDFCGIPPAKFEVISLEQQFAEKVHAMILDRGERENSRVKDLVDILLLIEGGLSKDKVRASLKNTFHRQGKMLIPSLLPKLPDSWHKSFHQMAIECCLLSSDFDAALQTVGGYWDELGEEDLLEN